MTETNTDTVATGRLAATKAQGQSIFELSLANRRAAAQRVDGSDAACLADIPEHLLREDTPGLPEVSELQAVRHYTNLSRQNMKPVAQIKCPNKNIHAHTDKLFIPKGL